MSDVISRQVAISAICSACGKIDCDKMDKCEKLQLPPANCSEFPNSSDTISRQAAIDAFNTNLNELVVGGEENAKTVENYLNRVLDKIKYLPSALSTNLAEVGTDCISRQAAIEAIDSFNVFESRGDQIKLEQMIGELPPAQPAIVPCNYVEACNVATMDKPISAYTYLSVLADLKDHGFVLVDMREVTE